jgi:hypothetical protein
VTLSPRVPGIFQIELNGKRFPVELAGGFVEAHIAVPDGVLDEGTNELAIRCEGVKCVAVEKIVIRLEPPGPPDHSR